MRIVAISDTHSLHEHLNLPEGDVLVHSGDALGHGKSRELERFVSWLDAQPHKHKVLIAGNHDWVWQRNPEKAKKIVGDVAHYLQDSLVEIEGKRFFGAPWTPQFYNWAFMADRGAPMRRKWRALEELATGHAQKDLVVVTHGPPLGVGDFVGSRLVGCGELLDVVRKVKPALHVFGHIHEGHGVYHVEETTETVFVNAAICTGTYRPTNPPIVVDLP